METSEKSVMIYEVFIIGQLRRDYVIQVESRCLGKFFYVKLSLRDI